MYTFQLQHPEGVDSSPCPLSSQWYAAFSFPHPNVYFLGMFAINLQLLHANSSITLNTCADFDQQDNSAWSDTTDNVPVGGDFTSH